MKVKLTQVYVTDKDKNGNPLMTKNNKPYTRMSIKTEQHGDKWISGFQNRTNANWKAGDEVDVVIKENGQYLNFETPKVENMQSEKLDKIMAMITELGMDVKTLLHRLPAKNIADMGEGDIVTNDEQMPFPDDDINPDDIPF